MFIKILYFILPIAVAISFAMFFVGSIYYMFSNDKAEIKNTGAYFIATAIALEIVSLVLLLLIR